MRILCASLLVALAVAADARACSCAAPDVREALRAGEAAFVGVVVERRKVGSSDREPVYDHTVRVEREYNVDLPARVTVRGGGHGPACGVSFRTGRRIGLWVDEPVRQPIRASLCSTVSPDELRRATKPLPAPRGTGRAALLLSARIGTDGTFAAYDVRGRLLAYGFGGGTVLAGCPGAERFLQQGRGRRLLVRATSDLRVLRTLRLAVRPVDAVCRDRRARDVVALGAGGNALARPGRPLMRVPGRGVIAMSRRDAVAVSGPEEQTRLRAVDLGTGAVRELATLAAFPFSMRFDARGRRMAFITTGLSAADAPVHASVLEMATGELRQSEITAADEGAVVWTGPDELLVIPAKRTRRALRFDASAQPLGTRSGLGWGTFSAFGRRLLQVAGNRLYGSTGGARRLLARLPVADVTVVALPERPRMRAPRRMPVRDRARARAAARRCER